MKVVLFCGGLGSRMREYSSEIPKPLVPLRGRPIVCHIMDYYARHGHASFILCLGYKGEKLRDYFEGGMCEEVVRGEWQVTLVDTGLETTIGGRLMLAAPLLAGEDLFLANYGDGLTDFPISQLIDRVRESKAIGGFLSVIPNHSFHFVHTRPDGLVLGVQDAACAGFRINGGFFVFRPEIFDFIEPGDELVVEPFARLIDRQKLVSCVHDGFWRCIDTLKDLKALEAWLDEQEANGRIYLGAVPRQPAKAGALV
jgi:glucose-1-phosphate cytidylyltransferase